MSEQFWIDEEVGPDAWKVLEELQEKFHFHIGMTELVWGTYPKEFTNERDSVGQPPDGEGQSATDATHR